MKFDKKKLKTNLVDMLVSFGAISGGVIVMNKVPSKAVPYVMAAVGLLGGAVSRNRQVGFASAIVGSIGLLQVVKDQTAGKSNSLASTVNSLVPTLSGVSGLGNQDAPLLSLGNAFPEEQADMMLGNPASMEDQVAMQLSGY